MYKHASKAGRGSGCSCGLGCGLGCFDLDLESGLLRVMTWVFVGDTMEQGSQGTMGGPEPGDNGYRASRASLVRGKERGMWVRVEGLASLWQDSHTNPNPM